MTTNTNMTVYNQYTDPTTKNVIFKKHLIDYVMWDDSLGVNLNQGYENADKVNVYIPKDKNDISQYKKPKEYNGTGWTLQNGDIIVKGNVNIDQVTGVKDLKNYDVFRITVMDDKDFGSKCMHHFEIRGN